MASDRTQRWEKGTEFVHRASWAVSLSLILIPLSNHSHVLVYKLGGTSLSVTVLEVNSGMYRVLATQTDHRTGGESFTHELAQHLAAEFKKSVICYFVILCDLHACHYWFKSYFVFHVSPGVLNRMWRVTPGRCLSSWIALIWPSTLSPPWVVPTALWTRSMTAWILSVMCPGELKLFAVKSVLQQKLCLLHICMSFMLLS